MSSCKRCAFPADAGGRARSCNNARLDAKKTKMMMMMMMMMMITMMMLMMVLLMTMTM